MKQVTVRLEKPLATALKQDAKLKAMPMTDLVKIILFDYYRNVPQ